MCAEEKKITLEDFIIGGGTFADVDGITPEMLESLYAMAYNLYDNGNYEDAKTIFSFLTFYSHVERRFWMGLGACEQMLKNYADAIEAYNRAILRDFREPDVYVFAGDCLLALGDKENAIKSFRTAVEYSVKSEHESIKTRAKGLLELLEEDSLSEENEEE